MVPAWSVLTAKRVALERKAAGTGRIIRKLASRVRELGRWRRPLKFDYCAMTADEMRTMMSEIIRVDQDDPETFRPIVGIGHTKDLIDVDAVEAVLDYLHAHGIRVSTFSDVYDQCGAAPAGGTA
jgi:hypothetical protein